MSATITTTSTAYNKDELSTPEVAQNLVFLRALEAEVRKLMVFDHPFLVRFSKGVYSVKGMRWALIQFGKHVRLFTSCLAHLLGTAPDIRDRVVLFDNLNEELGKGDLRGTHFMLYQRMLYSLEVTREEFDRTETYTAMSLLNDGLMHAVRHTFIDGLAWLGLGGEITIPNNFPYLAQGIRHAFPAADLAFFERHGDVDQCHSDDSNVLLALHVHSDGDRQRVRAEILKSLYLRGAVWDEIADRASRI